MAKPKNARGKAKPKKLHSHGAKKHATKSAQSPPQRRTSSPDPAPAAPTFTTAPNDADASYLPADTHVAPLNEQETTASTHSSALTDAPDGQPDAGIPNQQIPDATVTNENAGNPSNLLVTPEPPFQPPHHATLPQQDQVETSTAHAHEHAAPPTPTVLTCPTLAGTDDTRNTGTPPSLLEQEGLPVELPSEQESLTSEAQLQPLAIEASTPVPVHATQTLHHPVSPSASLASDLILQAERHPIPDSLPQTPSSTQVAPLQSPKMDSVSPPSKPVESSPENGGSSRTVTPKNFGYGSVTPSHSSKPSSSTSTANTEQDHEPNEQTSLLKPNVDGSDTDLEGQTDALSSKAQDYEGLPEVRKRMIYIFPALAIGVFLSAADQTIIASSYGRIGSDLDALNKTSWIATAYFLTLTSFQPLYGKLSDIFSRKSCLLISYLIFGLGALFCGLAQTIDQLILARALAGIGGGGMTTVVSILLSDAISLKDRGTWQGFINIIYAAGAATGAPLGGYLADSIGWRWAFIGQAPLCLAAFIAVGLTLKLPAREPQHWLAKLKRIDFLGAFVLVSAVFSLLFGMDRGSNVAWSEKSAYIPVIASLPLFALFLLVETKVAAEPFAPGNVIFNRSLFFAYASNFFAFAGWIAAIFYLPLFYQAVTGLTATQAGLLLIPTSFLGVTGSLASGIYMKLTGRYYWLTVIAYAVLFVGMAIVTLSSGILVASVPLMVIGGAIASLGNGSGVTTTLIALIANVSREEQAVVTACSYLFRSLGSTTGVSLASTAFNQVLRTQLRSQLGNADGADKIVEEVRKSIDYLRHLSPHVQEIVRQCYSSSTHAAFVVSTVLVAGAAVSAWGLREKSLSR